MKKILKCCNLSNDSLILHLNEKLLEAFLISMGSAFQSLINKTAKVLEIKPVRWEGIDVIVSISNLLASIVSVKILGSCDA